MFLVDTNVWLERLLAQERAAEVADFFNNVPSDQFTSTDFALHSIALVCIRERQLELITSFVQDVFIDGTVNLIALQPEDLLTVAGSMKDQQLNFDDAYQYVAAQKHNLIIVSLDPDFDRTERGRMEPAQALKHYRHQGASK